jgi:hypothetical protein
MHAKRAEVFVEASIAGEKMYSNHAGTKKKLTCLLTGNSFCRLDVASKQLMPSISMRHCMRNSGPKVEKSEQVNFLMLPY